MRSYTTTTDGYQGSLQFCNWKAARWTEWWQNNCLQSLFVILNVSWQCQYIVSSGSVLLDDFANGLFLSTCLFVQVTLDVAHLAIHKDMQSVTDTQQQKVEMTVAQTHTYTCKHPYTCLLPYAGNLCHKWILFPWSDEDAVTYINHLQETGPGVIENALQHWFTIISMPSRMNGTQILTQHLLKVNLLHRCNVNNLYSNIHRTFHMMVL